MKKIFKDAISIVLLILVGGLAIIEMVFNVVFQIVRLIRRMYRTAMNALLGKAKNFYGKRDRKQFEKIVDDIKIIEYDL